MPDIPTMEKNPLPAQDWHQIAGWLAAADVDCIEITSGAAALRMVRGSAGYQLQDLGLDAAQGAGSAPLRAAALAIKAQVPGLFLTRHPSGHPQFASQGERVREGELVALLQTGLLLTPVLAPVTGMLGPLLLAPGALAGYGTGLIEIFPEKA
jgi:acetyl-CoA carboxylase biotin carboxyl carrier protein